MLRATYNKLEIRSNKVQYVSSLCKYSLPGSVILDLHYSAKLHYLRNVRRVYERIKDRNDVLSRCRVYCCFLSSDSWERMQFPHDQEEE